MRDRKNDTIHRRVLEAKLGRRLTKAEVAHHADEEKGNNTSANLSVKTRSVHTTDHNRTRGLSKLRASLRMTNERKRLY